MTQQGETNRFLLKKACRKMGIYLSDFAEVEMGICVTALYQKLSQKNPMKHKEIVIIENKTGLICNCDNQGKLVLEEEK